MDSLNDKEKLALLGFDDPKHSLTWYKEHFDNMPKILANYIIQTVKDCNIFPCEAKNLKERSRYQNFYLLIEIEEGKYVVKINNTDRGEIKNSYIFNNAEDAAKFLISKSFTSGGAVNQYWEA
jgi:hypothetical protein